MDIITAARMVGYTGTPVVDEQHVARIQRIAEDDYQTGRIELKNHKLAVVGLGVLVCASGFGIGLAAAFRQEAPEPHLTCRNVYIDAVPVLGTQKIDDAYVSAVAASDQVSVPRLHVDCTPPTTAS